jgi:hypothetical protein
MEYWTFTNGVGQVLTAWHSRGQLHVQVHEEAEARKYPIDGPIESCVPALSGTSYGPWKCAKASLGPGRFHPRIQREMASFGVLLRTGPKAPPMEELFPAASAAVRQSARNILRQLPELFRFLEPAPRHRRVYSDQLRALLILACTEVESSWKAILHANGVPKAKLKKLRTSDYVKLLHPMRLSEWRLSLPNHPRWPPVEPFRSWDASKPSESLPWYDAYNATKHDREGALHRATLDNVVSAMAGVVVMVAAQFGVDAIRYKGAVTDEFVVDSAPKWSPSEWYVPPRVVGRDDWRRVKLRL